MHLITSLFFLISHSFSSLVKCAVGAFALELAMKEKILKKVFDINDFKHVYDEEGVKTSVPWYENFVFPKCEGNGTQARVYSQPGVYRTYYHRYQHMFESQGMSSTAVTHLSRHYFAKNCSRGGCSKEDTMAMAWSRDSCFGNIYDTDVPMEPVRHCAGFSRTEGMMYYARANTTPSTFLIHGVYPIIPLLIEGLANETVTPEKTLQGFIESLQYLAIVALQDYAVLWENLKKHPLTKKHPFNSVEFLDFKSELLESIKNDTHSEKVTSEALAVIQSEAIKVVLLSVKNESSMLKNQVQELMKELQSGVRSSVSVGSVVSSSSSPPTKKFLKELNKNVATLNNTIASSTSSQR